MATNVIVQPRQQVNMIPATTPANTVDPRKLDRLVVFKLGISEVALGGFVVLFNVATLLYTRQSYRLSDGLVSIAPGIWCGIFPILSGISGIRLKTKPSTCQYIINVTLCVFSSCSMIALILISSIIAGTSADLLVAIHVMFAGIGFALLVICIMHLSYCSWVCRPRKAANHVVYTPAQPPPNVQQVQLGNGQYMLVQNPVIVGQPYPTVPVVQAPFQPLMFQPMTSSSVLPQQTQPPMNPVKGNQPDVALIPPDDTDPFLPSYNSLNFDDHNSNQ